MDHTNFALVLTDYKPVGLTFDAEHSYMASESAVRPMRIEGDKIPGGALEGTALELKDKDGRSVTILAGDEFWVDTARTLLAMIPVKDSEAQDDQPAGAAG